MSVTQQTVLPPTPALPAAPPLLRIAPPRGWLELNLREVWEYRELLYFFVWRDLKIRYKQTAIGAAWAVLQPFLTMIVFSLFFGALAGIPSHGLPYPIFYFSALLPWMYFAGALQNATNTVVEQQRVITKVYFPRLVLPLAAVLSGLVDLAIGFVVFLGMMLYYGMTPQCRPVALRAQRNLPRCALRAALSDPVLDVCLTCGVSQQPGAGALALALRTEPHGRRY